LSRRLRVGYLVYFVRASIEPLKLHLDARVQLLVFVGIAVDVLVADQNLLK
jgi:hypothetical protein